MNIKNQIIQAPPINSLNNHAMFLGVLFLNPTYQHHFSSHYANLQYDPDSIWKVVNFIIPRFYTNEDFLVVTEMGYNRFDMFSEKGFIEIIYNMLRKGYYLYTHVNERYIPDSSSYQKFDFMHDTLLYGIDLTKKKLDRIAYVVDDSTGSAQYKPSELDCDDFIKSIKNILSRNYLHFFKNKEDYEFSFDGELLISQLYDYLNSQNKTFDMNYSPSCLFGISVYDALIKDIESNEIIDLRITKILLEHKRCMLERIKYMISHHIIPSADYLLEYEDIVIEFEKIHNLAIKYSITRSRAIKNHICEKIKYSIEPEKYTLLKLVSELEKSPNNI